MAKDFGEILLKPFDFWLAELLMRMLVFTVHPHVIGWLTYAEDLQPMVGLAAICEVQAKPFDLQELATSSVGLEGEETRLFESNPSWFNFGIYVTELKTETNELKRGEKPFFMWFFW